MKRRCLLCIIEIFSRPFFQESSMTFFNRVCITGFLTLQWLPSVINAADNDQEIYNQLYREIISSSRDVKSIKMDSMQNRENGASKKPEQESPALTPSDPVSERLKQEIDKMVQDAKIRHSDAVKFMQDTH
jgi:hypothetical protein